MSQAQTAPLQEYQTTQVPPAPPEFQTDFSLQELRGPTNWYAVWSPTWAAGPWFGTWDRMRGAMPRGRLCKRCSSQVEARAYLKANNYPGVETAPRFA